MRRRSRLLRIAKWGGAAACGVVSLARVISFFVTLEFRFDGVSSCALYAGCIYWDDGYYVSMERPDGWYVDRTHAPMQIFVLPRWNGRFRFLVPLWIVMVLGGAVTGLLFRLHRRRPAPGHCRCGYDLTGNVSGTCPECGVEAVSETGK